MKFGSVCRKCQGGLPKLGNVGVLRSRFQFAPTSKTETTEDRPILAIIVAIPLLDLLLRSAGQVRTIVMSTFVYLSDYSVCLSVCVSLCMLVYTRKPS